MRAFKGRALAEQVRRARMRKVGFFEYIKEVWPKGMIVDMCYKQSLFDRVKFPR